MHTNQMPYLNILLGNTPPPSYIALMTILHLYSINHTRTFETEEEAKDLQNDLNNLVLKVV